LFSEVPFKKVMMPKIVGDYFNYNITGIPNGLKNLSLTVGIPLKTTSLFKMVE